MEPFLRLGLLAVQDDGEGQDVDEQTPGAMSICDDGGDESEDITEEALTMHFCNGARMISRNTQYTRRMREPSRITTTAK